MLLNDLLSVDMRLARIIVTLFRARGESLSERLKPVPVPVTVLQLAEMVHADRAFLSRILSKWREAECFERKGRRSSSRGRSSTSVCVLRAGSAWSVLLIPDIESRRVRRPPL